VCISLCTTATHNTAQNSYDYFSSDNHHCSDAIYWREGDIVTTEILNHFWHTTNLFLTTSIWCHAWTDIIGISPSGLAWWIYAAWVAWWSVQSFYRNTSVTDRQVDNKWTDLIHQYWTFIVVLWWGAIKTHHLDVIDGVVFPFLISRDLAVTAVDKIQANCWMQAIVVCINAIFLQWLKPTQWNPLI